MSSLKGTVENIDTRLAGVEQNTALIPAIKAAVTDHTHQQNRLETRVTALETTSAN